MKNFLKATLLVAFLSFGGWALTTQPRIYETGIARNQTGQPPTTRDLYLKNCARCHGEDGKSQTKIGESLEATDLTSREVRKTKMKSVIETITHGREAMPSFEKKLSKKEIKALSKYIRTLK